MVSGRSVALLGVGILLGLVGGAALPYAGVFLAGPPAVPEELVRERSEADKAIAAAEVDLKQQSLPPLAKALLAARLEIVKTSSALLQQRMAAIRSWTRQEMTLPVAQSNPERLAAVEREIASTTARLKEQTKENDKWAGGLIKALTETGVATSQMTLAMLETERIKAKYGIAWMPSLPSPPAEGVRASQSLPMNGASPRARTTLVARLSNKRFIERDFERKIPEDSIRLDIDWDTAGLPRPTRAVKGTLVFADLFGEEKLVLDLTVNIPLAPGQPFEQKGRGFTYNQFMESHRWVKETELSNMTIAFIAQEIIYQDGEREKL